MFKNMKLFTLATLLALCPLTASATIYLPESLSHLSQDHTALNTYMKSLPEKQSGWDIHSVLGYRPLLKTAVAVSYSLPSLTSAVSRLAYALVTKTKNSIYNTWRSIQAAKKLLKSGSSGEPYYNIFKANKEEGLAAFIDRLEMAYVPTPGIQNIMERINARGHKQRIVSNIGPHYFDLMKNTFANTQDGNKIFTLATVGKIVAYNNFGYTTAHTLAASQVSQHQKPEPEFFRNHNATYNVTPQAPVIFIDDSMKNIEAARKEGWICIHFDCKKHSIAQLEKELEILDLV